MISFIYSETRAPTVSRVHPHHQIILFLVSLCFHVLIRTIFGGSRRWTHLQCRRLLSGWYENVCVYESIAYWTNIIKLCAACSFLPFRKEDYVEGVDKRMICFGMVRRLRHCFSALLCHSQQWMFLEKHFNDSFNKGFKLSVGLCNANKLRQFRVCWQFANKFMLEITTRNRTQRMLCQEHSL